MKTPSISWVAAALLALTVSQPIAAHAQEEGEAPAAEQATTDAAPAAEQATTDAAPEEAAPEESAAPAESAAASKEGAAATDRPKLGPGGKPLREDYPGTEESKQARMETERIEGLSFNEGDDTDEVYDLRIRELETKVDDLKETVFRSKSRIVLLKETVLNGTMAGSRAIVSHVNELGGTYVLQRALYSLDGARIFNEQDKKGGLDGRSEIEIFKGSISPGTHRISVLMELQGSGYNVFNYMGGYKFSVQDSCEFTAQEGSSAVVKVRLYEKGGALTRYEDRLGIDCAVNLVDLTKANWVEDNAAEQGAKPDAGDAKDDAAKNGATSPDPS